MLRAIELLIVASVAAQKNGDEAPDDVCLEPNGKFRDPEQCDLFYICRNGVATVEYCPEGLLFDDSNTNHEKCVYPHQVDCGVREYVQETNFDEIDAQCLKANGLFNFNKNGEEINVCNKYIQCDNGRAFELPCAGGLLFDVTQGTCVRSEERQEGARICTEAEQKSNLIVEGFSCPSGQKTGPQGLTQAHSIYRHPQNCQYYFACYFNREPNKFGCSFGNVFDDESQTCVPVDEGPDRCFCEYECPEEPCPGNKRCKSDCSCPAPDEEGYEYED